MPHRQTAEVFRFGVFEADLQTGELFKAGRKIGLQEQPFEILVMLLMHPGRVVTHQELRAALWADQTFVDFDHGIRTAINKIRDALGDRADNPRFIETLPRRGYRFVAPVLSLNGDHQHLQSHPGLVSALRAATRPAEERQKAPLSIQSIVVLPLINLSDDAQQEYFVDGMTDELITNLSKIKSLKVISRTSAMLYKRTRKALQQVAEELGVDAAVEGSVLRSGKRVRITVQLIDTATDRHLWAESYERELKDVLRLQHDVATAIANEIKVTVSPGEKMQLAGVGAINPEAYEAYLRGRYHWNKRTEEDFGKSIENFLQATETDPTCARAYAGLANCYNLLPIYAAVPPREAFPQAKIAARRALELDERLAEAHTALAWSKLVYDWDWSGADEEFRRALELDPAYETAHQFCGLQHIWKGEFDAGLAELRRAQELDPVSPVINRSLGMGCYFARLYDDAIEHANKALELDTTFPRTREWIGLACLHKGMPEEAIATLERAVELEKGQLSTSLAVLGYAYGKVGRRENALSIIRQLDALSKQKYVTAVRFVFVYLGLGEKDQAFAWLEKAYEERATELVMGLKVDARFDALRSDARFDHLLQCMHFPR